MKHSPKTQWPHETRCQAKRVRLISVTGGVGSDDPLESIADALGAFPATHVLLATSTEQDSYWLEQGLLVRRRQK